MIEAELKDRPQVSNRRIAADLGVHHTTVSTVRKKAEEGGEISHQEKRIGRDGVTQRTTKPASKPPAAALGMPYRGYACQWSVVRNPYRKAGPRSLLEPGCLDFSRSLELRLNHMQKLPVIATTDAGELQLWEDSFGLAVAFRLKSGFPMIVKWIREGHVNGLSIGYTIMASRFDNAGVEIITRATADEVSLVGWPAFNLARAWPAQGQALPGLSALNRRWLNGGTPCRP